MRIPDALVSIALAVQLALPAAAQAPPPSEPEPRDISQVPLAPLDGTIGIPLPNMPEAEIEKFEVPELAGTRTVVGTQLVNGHLPRPLADYFVRVNVQVQRITLFEGGLVSIHLAGATGSMLKKVLIPEGAMNVFRDELSAADLAFVPDAITTSSDVATLRIYDSSGNHVDRRFSPSSVLPPGLQRCRLLLEDLLRAIAEDRGVTGPMVGYVPAVGDRLVGEDKKIYTVTRLMRNGELVEMSCASEPVKKYFETKSIPRFFVGAARNPRN